MRVAAIIYIVLSLGANVIFDSLTVLLFAMFSFPLLLWLLLTKKKKTLSHPKPNANALQQKKPASQTAQ
jgi:hypothetical protein